MLTESLKKSPSAVTNNDNRPWVPYTMPKAEMHVHISLALANEVFLRRVKRRRTTLSPEFLLEREQRYYPDLQKFHSAYEAMRHITSSERELASVAQIYLQRLAREGAIYAELSISYREGANFPKQIEALSHAIEAARHNNGIEARLVVTSLRDHGANMAEKAVKAIMAIDSPYVTAFGLVGNEAFNPMMDFERAMAMAWHDAGVGLVPHVAEQRIENALDFLRVAPEDALKNPLQKYRKLRAGHGTLTHRSSELMQRFADHGICLEVCLSANKRIGVPDDIKNEHPENRAYSSDKELSVDLDHPLAHYFSDLKNHPLPHMLRAGIPVCLGSDNPLLMNTNIGKEYSLARKYGGCSLNDCLNFTRNAIRYANVGPITEKRLMQHIDHYDTLVKAGKPPQATALGYQEAMAELDDFKSV